jgi:hypothetical protein
VRGVHLPGKELDVHQIADTFQSAIQRTEEGRELSQVSTPSYVAEVLATYSEKMACDIKTWNGSTVYAVPVRTTCGLNSDNEVYGTLELPAVGDFVFVEFLAGKENAPIITGTIFPYYNKYFQDSQKPVKSTNKAFTKKLLEKSKLKTFRKVFLSGTTVEVQDDGSVIIETPSGSFVHMKESDGKIIITSDGNMIELNGNSKDFVTHTELNTALQTFLTALKAAVAAGCQAGAGGVITTVTIDISSAKATKVKTG